MITNYLKRKKQRVLSIIKNLEFMIKDPTVKIESKTSVSRNTIMEGFNRIRENSTFTGELGKYSYIGSGCKISAKVGRFCSIGSNIETISATHPVSDFISSHAAFYSTSSRVGKTFVNKNRFERKKYVDKEKRIDVAIGNDVWIGNNVLILGGNKIGNGAIIAAGSVVTKDVQPYSVVGGVPAKLIKKRFDAELIEKLQDIEWWNKDEEWLAENAIYFNDFEEVRNW